MLNDKMLILGKEKSVIRTKFEEGKILKKEYGDDNVYDFSLGNPSIPSPKVLKTSLLKLIDSEIYDLHSYTSSQGDLEARKSIADYLNKTYSVNESADRIYLTCGAAASITITLNALLNDGDEVIIIKPFFPEYKVFVEKAGGKPVFVNSNEKMGLDVNNIKNAITEKTKVIIINSPNNPGGVVYSEDSLIELSKLLKDLEKENNQVIYVLSDEPYREIVYDNKTCPYTAKYIDNTISCYSFSKSLSIPGERIGYICVCEKCYDGDNVFFAVNGSGRSLGYVCAPSLFQKVIPYVIGHTSDIREYDKNRKLLHDILIRAGFECIYPEGAFYMFIKAPNGDSNEFCENAKKYNIIIVRGDEFGDKRYARIAYCVKEQTIINSEDSWMKLGKEYKLI